MKISHKTSDELRRKVKLIHFINYEEEPLLEGLINEILDAYSNQENQTTLEDFIMAHRYLYYCVNSPQISDSRYDVIESAALRVLPESSAIRKTGSSFESDYSEAQKQIAKKLIL